MDISLKNMHQRKTGSFRHRSNGRRFSPRTNNSGDRGRVGQNSFSNNRGRNNFNSNQSAEKLVEKYNTLAKESLSAGDRTLSENYFQHADHFIRIVESKNLSQNQKKAETIREVKAEDANISDDTNISQNNNIEEKKI